MTDPAPGFHDEELPSGANMFNEGPETLIGSFPAIDEIRARSTRVPTPSWAILSGLAGAAWAAIARRFLQTPSPCA